MESFQKLLLGISVLSIIILIILLYVILSSNKKLEEKYKSNQIQSTTFIGIGTTTK